VPLNPEQEVPLLFDTIKGLENKKGLLVKLMPDNPA
jgi:hypothetical protein